MWRSAAAYFPCTLHKTAELPPGRPYLFGYHPHGILSFGAWLSMGTDALGLSRKFPGIDIRLLTLNINFRAPFLREYLLLHGVCECAAALLLCTAAALHCMSTSTWAGRLPAVRLGGPAVRHAALGAHIDPCRSSAPCQQAL